MIEHNVPIKRLNSWRLGSVVKYYADPKSEAELLNCFNQGQDTKHGLIFLGLGSNVLFPDAELDAVLVRMRHLNEISVNEELVEAQSGIALAKLSKRCVKLGMKDAAFLAGIPGMLGGALKMNAGAHSYSTWDYIVSVRAYTDLGIQTLYPEDFEIGYRSVRYKHGQLHCFLSAVFRFDRSCPNVADQYMRLLLKKRNAVQPIGTYNCGCVFRNLPGQSIGRLLDQLGFRGYQSGFARVSPVHANFIENLEQKATSKDVLALITMMRDAVQDAVGVVPKLEVIIYD